jgi:hypothetical protein
MTHLGRCVLGSAFLLGPALAGDQADIRVAVVLMPDGRYSSVAVQEMGREAARIMRHSGVALTWRIGATAEVFEEPVVVVQLRGRCSMGEPLAAAQGGRLGWTHAVDGTVLPFSDVACDEIRSTIQSAMATENHLIGNHLLGKAMGRVLAHELYHVIGNTAKHSSDGVARRALSGDELISGYPELRPGDAEVIRNGFQRSR